MAVEILNDPRHTAIHEAGHAVIGRVLNQVCDYVTVIVDEDSAGHSITADPYATLHELDMQGRWRDMATIVRGRIITYMAGAEAERLIIGECQGEGDFDDRCQIAMMIDTLVDKGGSDRLEARLRWWTRTLCRRHQGRILLLAGALLKAARLTDEKVREIINLPKRPHDPYMAALSSAE